MSVVPYPAGDDFPFPATVAKFNALTKPNVLALNEYYGLIFSSGTAVDLKAVLKSHLCTY